MNHLTCQEVIDFISDYLEDVLPDVAAARFEAHLAICADCRAYLDNFRTMLQATKGAYASQAALDIPEELVQAILASGRTTP